MFKIKENVLRISLEVNAKDKFLTDMGKFKVANKFTYEMNELITFLKWRVNDMEVQVDKVRDDIDLVLDITKQMVDDQMSRSAKLLDFLMILLTFITIVFLPASIIGGTMGINVIVPYQFDVVESTVPFYVLCVIILACMILIAYCFVPLLKDAFKV